MDVSTMNNDSNANSDTSSQAGTPTEEFQIDASAMMEGPASGKAALLQKPSMNVMLPATPVKAKPTGPEQAGERPQDPAISNQDGEELAREQERCKQLEEQLKTAMGMITGLMESKKQVIRRMNEHRHHMTTEVQKMVGVILDKKEEKEEDAAEYEDAEDGDDYEDAVDEDYEDEYYEDDGDEYEEDGGEYEDEYAYEDDGDGAYEEDADEAEYEDDGTDASSVEGGATLFSEGETETPKASIEKPRPTVDVIQSELASMKEQHSKLDAYTTKLLDLADADKPSVKQANERLEMLEGFRGLIKETQATLENSELADAIAKGVMTDLLTWKTSLKLVRETFASNTLLQDIKSKSMAPTEPTNEEEGAALAKMIKDLNTSDQKFRVGLAQITKALAEIRKNFVDVPTRAVNKKKTELRNMNNKWLAKLKLIKQKEEAARKAEEALDMTGVNSLADLFADSDVEEELRPDGPECVRGPHWKYGSQDGTSAKKKEHAKGIITKYVKGDWSEVYWLETKNTNTYRTGADGKWDIRVLDREFTGWKRPSFKKGDRVCVGPDWSWGEQNTNYGAKTCEGFGTITGYANNSWSTVRWDHGGAGRYRTGVSVPNIKDYRAWDVSPAPEDAPKEPNPTRDLKEFLTEHGFEKYYDSMNDLKVQDKMHVDQIQSQLSSGQITSLLGKIAGLGWADGNKLKTKLTQLRQLCYSWKYPSHNFYNSNPSGGVKGSGLSSGVGYGSGNKNSSFSVEAWQAAHVKSHCERSTDIERIHELLLTDASTVPDILDSSLLEYVDEVLCIDSILGAGKIQTAWERVCALTRFLARIPLVRKRIDFSRWIKSLRSLQKDIKTALEFGDGSESSDADFAASAERVVEETLLAMQDLPPRTHTKCELCSGSGNYYNQSCARCYSSGKLPIPALESVPARKAGEERTPTCFKNHPLQCTTCELLKKPTNGSKPYQGVRCDLCSASGLKGEIYHCPECRWDACPKCHTTLTTWTVKGSVVDTEVCETEAEMVRAALDVGFPLIHEGLQVKLGDRAARVSGPVKDGKVPLKFPEWNKPLSHPVEEVAVHHPFWHVHTEQDDEKEDVVEINPRQRWVDAMTPTLFGTQKEFVKPDFLYKSDASAQLNKPLAKLIRRRLAKEFSSISKTLTCDPDATIWLRVMDGKQKMTRIRFLVSAPPGTPYTRGLWLFDMWVTDRYPLEPPKCKTRTTGHGKVRFNPNLYADGYVCLSVLNTWQGAKEEMWGPHQTLVAICIAIQSAILGQEHPYFNEPGYEQQYGSKSAMKQSDNYNKVRRVETIRWAMTDHMRNPTPGFEDAIKFHFLHHKTAIMEQAQKWQEKDKFSQSVVDDLKSAYEFLATPSWPKKAPENK